MNNIKDLLRQTLIEDKFSISFNTIINIKSGVLEVLKKYTKINDESININIKISKTGKYRIELIAVVDDIF